MNVKIICLLVYWTSSIVLGKSKVKRVCQIVSIYLEMSNDSNILFQYANLVFLPICLCRELNRWKVICQRDFLQPTVNRQWAGRRWTCRDGFFSFEKLIVDFGFYLRYPLHVCRKLLELARIYIFGGCQL